MPSFYSPPGCLLTPGQPFVGTQHVMSPQSKEEAWKVHVQIQACDFEHGYLCGSMEALNVPNVHSGNESSVLTFWEGEIIDNVNYKFFTNRWDASKSTDLKHWGKFDAFDRIRERVQEDGGSSLDLRDMDHIFMRWKEKFFVNVGPDCGLTIAGFYYVCFDRQQGTISGLYFDPNSTPFQKLELKVATEQRKGYGFANYKFQ